MALEHPAEDHPPDRPAGEVAAVFDRRERERFGPGGAAGAGDADVRGQRHLTRLARRPERLPRAVVVLEVDAVPGRREVHAAQAGFGRPLDLADRGVDVPHRDVREADVAFGLDRAEVGQPAVVDALADRRQHRIDVEARVVAQQLRQERHRFAVLAPVEDHLGGDAVAIHVAQALVDVVVPRGPRVRVAAEAGEPSCRSRLPVRGDEGVEVVEVRRRAVVAELLLEQRADVGVRRHHDERDRRHR